jgi:acyl CoA:acetate/3-ketoacid CoA transferase beta subunit
MTAAEIRLRADCCALALAETFRGDGEILASPIGLLPSLAARFAKRTFAPDLLLTDGVATLIADCPPLRSVDAREQDTERPADAPPVAEGYLPYRAIFDTVWSGRRHVIMGASQIDRYGNQNIAFIGDPTKPRSQLLGMRGAPGNTLCHPVSYFIPAHSPRVFVERVDVVSGVGYDRARALGSSARFHEIRRVVSNLGVFDFATPDRCMRLVSTHPGVPVARVIEQTGFSLVIAGDIPETRTPDASEQALLRSLDPEGLALAGLLP